MCPGTVKILCALGSIEKSKNENGLSMVLSSPEEAGRRLYTQAMESMEKKRIMVEEA